MAGMRLSVSGMDSRVRQTAVYMMLWLVAMTLPAQNLVFLEHSDVLAFDRERLPDAQILRGDVRFRHEEALMFCDSAYFYEKSNSVTAFGHVRFLQGDTLSGYGDRLYYDGNTRLARLCRHVRLIHRSTTLTTDSLNYDRNTDLAYYFTGGTIQDSLNLLKSVWGQYCTATNQALFRKDVHLQNERFTFDTDTLLYNTKTSLAQIVCPTVIVYDTVTTILSSNGSYNTDSEQSVLYDRSLITHNDGKQLTADTIFYNKKTGYGRLLHNIELRDTAQHLTLYGHFGEAWEENKRGYVTDSAHLIECSEADNPSYVHADTLYTQQIPYTDTLGQDTSYQQITAWHHVRAYNRDYQLVCDSLSANSRDSIAVLHRSPVCWADSNQVSADSITLYFVNDRLHHIYGVGVAFGTRQINDTCFDQMAGKEMWAWLNDSTVYKVDVTGNAQTVFYPKEDDGSLIGVNTTQSSFIQIFLENRKIDHILFTTATQGVLYPLDQVSKKERFLGGYFWAEAERPLSPDDIFRMPPRTERPRQQTVSATEDIGDTPPAPSKSNQLRHSR